MSSIIKAATRHRTFLLASTFLVPMLTLGVSTARAQQTPSDQLPPIEVSPPADETRTRARPVTGDGYSSRRPGPNVASTGSPAGGAPADGSSVASPGNAATT